MKPNGDQWSVIRVQSRVIKSGCPILSPPFWRKGGIAPSLIPSKGHGLTVCAKTLSKMDKVSGHDLSRAVTGAKLTRGFSPCATLAILTALLALITLPSPLPAQRSKPWQQIPIPPLHAFHPQQPRRIELKNGIVIFLQEDHELPFVNGSVVIPGGSRDETPAKAGLVALYSQAWRTSGTAKMDGDAMDDLLESKAAHIESAGDVDSTALSWDSLKGDSDQVFNLAIDLLFHPKFSEKKLELAQQQEATAIVRRNDDEGGIAERESAKLVYGANSPYTRQPELATIRAVTLADLQAWHERTLKRKLIIGISGDFDPAVIEARVRAVFEGLPPVTPQPPRHDAFPGPSPGVYFIDKEDVDQSNVQIVGLGIERSNPDATTIVVLNEILGGGFGSRLFQTVRTKLGLAYAVGGGLGLEYDHPASFDVEVLTKSASTVDATRAADGEIAGLVARPFTEAELRAPRATSSTPSSSVTTRAKRFLTSAKGSSSMGIPRTILRPTTLRLKK